MNLFQLLLGFSGRITRAKYWFAAVVYIAILAVDAFVAYKFNSGKETSGLIILLTLASSFHSSFEYRRRHQTDARP